MLGLRPVERYAERFCDYGGEVDMAAPMLRGAQSYRESWGPNIGDKYSTYFDCILFSREQASFHPTSLFQAVLLAGPAQRCREG